MKLQFHPEIGRAAAEALNLVRIENARHAGVRMVTVFSSPAIVWCLVSGGAFELTMTALLAPDAQPAAFHDLTCV